VAKHASKQTSMNTSKEASIYARTCKQESTPQRLNFNPTNQPTFQHDLWKKRQLLRAVYTVQNIVYSLQIIKGVEYLEIRSI
jgi:hypothetical protein